ncbi:hypothetical protein [Enterococcus sp. 5H]|uniref:hypothetical protein n=1 Tax=Enterococcus sp. 5H TaxID=1229490 RepID=UPI002304CD89|nr:hypothetical protein [Enterococcus sp. 5H]MDA9472943.1 hypothetical protein [Enterococcus sp. 5H]
MERTYINQLTELESEYEQNQRTIEEELEEVFYEKQKFGRELENLSENYSYHYQQAEYSEPINMSRVYHLLDQCKDDSDRVVNQTVKELENRQEENTIHYKKQTQLIEDELTLFKEMERKKEDE